MAPLPTSFQETLPVGGSVRPATGEMPSGATSGVGPLIGREVLGSILEQVDIGVILLEEESREVLYANSHAEKLLGEGVDGAVEDLVQTLLPPGLDDLDGKWGRPQSARTKDRVFGFTPYRLPTGLACLFVRDITERTRAASLSAASSSMESLESLFSSLRHEIANPLNGIKMTLSVLKQNVNRLPRAAVDDYLARALGEVGKLESLIRALKDFSWLGQLRVQRVAIEEFLEAFGATLRSELGVRGIATRLEYESGLGELWADPMALRTVLVNVVTNATDALPGSRDPEIRIRARRSGALLVLVVSDNGRGVAEEHKGRLFEPFFTTKSQATGLGLVATRKLLAQMGGEIEIESRAGVGTEVTITLPGAGPERCA